ncbi:hypothetical protein [Thalassotalea sp. PLHSN55]|uniref:hypothetical protein n=1 Tax=Thalassotalea sp. PLHSN55 TaxID=3435888 RepID=UPI003F8460E7
MNKLAKSLKVLTLSGLIAVSCTALPAWTKVNVQPAQAAQTSSYNATIAVVYTGISDISPNFVTQQVVIKTNQQPDLHTPAEKPHQVKGDGQTHNNIFDIAIIFNDKLQQFLAAFSRFIFSNAHAETAKVMDQNNNVASVDNCKVIN